MHRCDVQTLPTDAVDADAGSIPQMGIELTFCLMRSVGDPAGVELVGLAAVGSGFRTFPQEFAAVVRR